jgi:hypothetical protein
MYPDIQEDETGSHFPCDWNIFGFWWTRPLSHIMGCRSEPLRPLTPRTLNGYPQQVGRQTEWLIHCFNHIGTNANGDFGCIFVTIELHLIVVPM